MIDEQQKRRIEALIDRYRESQWQQPIRQHNLEGYAELKDELVAQSGSIILDSCCGTALSTRKLAARYPNHLVIGIDQSMDRLARQGQGELPENARLVRGQVEDWWRLLLADQIRLSEHYLLYPNPWPKPGHLQRRWQGHPVFPVLMELGGRIELRCNYRWYAEEFSHAAGYVLGRRVPIVELAGEGLTRFEQKYSDREESLWQVVITA